MSEPGADLPITLDQLKVFLTVVEEGSFSSAARRLRRVQSAVSYAIANLERLLDVELFDRSGRRPVLTEAGRTLVADARAVTDRVDRLKARARHFGRGLEAQVSVAVDFFYPLPALLAAVEDFRQAHPTVGLQLRTEGLGAVAHLVLEGECHLGVSTELEDFPRELTWSALMEIELVPVCAPDHPLAQIEGPLHADALEEHVQVVMTDRSRLTEGRDWGVLSPHTWRVADLGAKRELLLSRLGWGNLPRLRVEEDLQAGRLVLLDIAKQRTTRVSLVAVYRTAEPPGPAGAWLLARLAEA